VFGLNDAPRLWWENLKRFLLKNGCRQSVIDPALFIYEVHGRLEGLIATHVDDLLSCGSTAMTRLLAKVDTEFGFGSREYDDFRHTGKRVRKVMDPQANDYGSIYVGMDTYVENMTTKTVSRSRRLRPGAKLDAYECKSLRNTNGELQWVQNQTRPDLAYLVSTSQSRISDPTVADLTNAYDIVRLAKQNADFELRFQPLCLETGGFLAVSDASLGGVDEAGGVSRSSDLPAIHSQGAYCIMFADKSLARDGRRGLFNLLDWRSRKLRRVCRSSFAAETLALADSNDAAQMLRGALLDIMSPGINFKYWEERVGRWPLTLVVDARDCYDHLIKETSSAPVQKSLLFDLAQLKQSIGEGHTTMRWTATENMLVDCMTKNIDTSHFLWLLRQGIWSIEYDAELVNEKTKRTKVSKKSADPVATP